MSAITPPFERTVCACRFCRDCCRAPGCLGPGDVERIAAYRQEPIDATLAQLQPGRGTLVLKADGRMERIPTIVPRKGVDGWCVFRDPDGLCSIHPVSPMGCAYFDLHLSTREGQKRSQWVVAAQSIDPVYRATVEALTQRDAAERKSTR